MICFRITLDQHTQAIKRVERLAKPPEIIHESLTVKYVFKPSEEEARAYYNEYMRNKVQARREKHAKEQKCKCGRDRDRPKPSGGFYRQCLVCKERRDAFRVRLNTRV